MSWIIRSSTTPTSVERKVNPLARTASMYFGCGHCGRGGREGRIESLDVAHLEHGAVARADSTSSSAAWLVVQSGFSTSR